MDSDEFIDVLSRACPERGSIDFSRTAAAAASQDVTDERSADGPVAPFEDDWEVYEVIDIYSCIGNESDWRVFEKNLVQCEVL